MQIIDFTRKGNVIRFYLGEKTPDWGWTDANYRNSEGNIPDWLTPSDIYYGDDWNDVPYEHNAGKVYDEFIKGYFDLAVDFDDLVLEPHDNGYCDSSYCKNDMVARKVPCIIIVPRELVKSICTSNNFNYWLLESISGNKKIKKYYFGDEINSNIINIKSYNNK